MIDLSSPATWALIYAAWFYVISWRAVLQDRYDRCASMLGHAILGLLVYLVLLVTS